MKQQEILEHDPSACLGLDRERSYHRFSDKSILEITYTKKKKQYVVSKFEFLEDQVSVLIIYCPRIWKKFFRKGMIKKQNNRELYQIRRAFL